VAFQKSRIIKINIKINMKTAIITGSGGLIGSEAVRFFHSKGYQIIGIDNDLRSYFFGKEASTNWNVNQLQAECKNYIHYSIDIREIDKLENVFNDHNSDIAIIIHTAAQPSHDWAAKEPFTDFTVNANGTLNLLELTRKYAPNATFIFTSTNKVYGDTPNFLPLIEEKTRWSLSNEHQYHLNGIDETMSIDNTKHSLFGASKVAADILVQEYGKYFNMNTVCFRGGCLTGPAHSGTQLHGFLSYLMKCAVNDNEYTIFGHKGKQVRDNIHSYDLVNMFWNFHLNPRQGEVYNAGGGTHSNCSMLEAIEICEKLTGRKMKIKYLEQNRIGDHIWWISDVSKFKSHYPEWHYSHNINTILQSISDSFVNKNKI
jgi:CDP-paratose 2-epimerase